MKSSYTFTLDGYQLKVVLRGQGEPLIILGSVDYYQRVMPKTLESHFCCVYIDHKGFAEKLNPDDRRYDLNSITHDFHAIISELGLRHFWLFGHSGHAYMALHYASRFGERVNGLLLSGVAPSLSEAMRSKALARWDQSAETARKRVFEREFAKLDSDIRLQPERKFVHLCRRLGAMRWYDYHYDELPLWQEVKTNTEVFDHLWGVEFACFDIEKHLESINQPIEIINGALDYSIAPNGEWETYTKQHKHLSLSVFAHCGHTPMLERQDDFVRWIIQKTQS